MKKALFIAVHPDDETLGCGGTMLRLKDEGWSIGWLVLTDVLPSMGWSDEWIRERRKQISWLREIYRIEFFKNLGFPTATLNELSFGKLIEGISGFIQEFQPDWVFLPNRTDVHSDHRKGFEASYSACKSFRAPFISKMFMYECISETEYAPPYADSAFIPNVFFDITPYFDKKIEMISVYESEVHPAPFPRSHLIPFCK